MIFYIQKDWIIAFILGFTEGITEFFPISSTGHMILVSFFLGILNEKTHILEDFVQLGSILAILYRYKFKLFNIFINYIRKRNLKKVDFKLEHILLAILPISILGFFLRKEIKFMFAPKYVIYNLFFGGIFLLLCEFLKPKKSVLTDIKNLTYLQSFFIGCFQCLALLPGFSRSGATIGGGILLGINRNLSTEFSFLISIPVLIGASILDIYKDLGIIFLHDYYKFCFLGLLIAFLTSLIVINFFIKIIVRTSFIPFFLYRILLLVLLVMNNQF